MTGQDKNQNNSTTIYSILTKFQILDHYNIENPDQYFIQQYNLNLRERIQNQNSSQVIINSPSNNWITHPEYTQLLPNLRFEDSIISRTQTSIIHKYTINFKGRSALPLITNSPFSADLEINWKKRNNSTRIHSTITKTLLRRQYYIQNPDQHLIHR